jgi:glycosyltransferase involved in cell wall biosynthesis
MVALPAIGRPRSAPTDMVKLVIQIPCYNEEQVLGITLDALPKAIKGVDQIEILVIDDGSTDRTVEVARARGVHHVVSFPRNRGLAAAFVAGLNAALAAGADIIVNTDADNQYRADDIPILIEPILRGSAEIVVGARPIGEIEHFSRTKKVLQALGSWVVRLVSGTSVADAPSGFRAYSRHAAMRMNVFGTYTYTLETIIQAGQRNMAIASVPIGVNPDLRPSRLIRSVPRYVLRSSVIILRVLIVYRPLRFFAVLSLPFTAIGALLILRFLYFYVVEGGNGYIQSLQIGTFAGLIGVLLMAFGVLADLIAANRRLLEDIKVRLWEVEDRLGKR